MGLVMSITNSPESKTGSSSVKVSLQFSVARVTGAALLTKTGASATVQLDHLHRCGNAILNRNKFCDGTLV